MGRTWPGAVLAHQSRFEESEAILLRARNKLRRISSHRGENHPDRLSAMIQLSLCYRLQGEYNEAIQLCDQIIEGLQKISVTQHPLERKTRAEKCEMRNDSVESCPRRGKGAATESNYMRGQDLLYYMNEQ
jgi:tetratricopeptide (TPR) repeat protein